MSNEGGALSGQWRSKHLLAARALASKDWEKPKDIQRARHMAHNGASTAEIAAALGWTVGQRYASARLRKYNIRTFNPSYKRHRGTETTFPESDLPDAAMAKIFRPRILEGA